MKWNFDGKILASEASRLQIEIGAANCYQRGWLKVTFSRLYKRGQPENFITSSSLTRYITHRVENWLGQARTRLYQFLELPGYCKGPNLTVALAHHANPHKPLQDPIPIAPQNPYVEGGEGGVGREDQGFRTVVLSQEGSKLLLVGKKLLAVGVGGLLGVQVEEFLIVFRRE